MITTNHQLFNPLKKFSNWMFYEDSFSIAHAAFSLLLLNPPPQIISTN